MQRMRDYDFPVRNYDYLSDDPEALKDEIVSLDAKIRELEDQPPPVMDEENRRRIAADIVHTLMCGVKDGQIRIVDASDALKFYWEPEEVVNLIFRTLAEP